MKKHLSLRGVAMLAATLMGIVCAAPAFAVPIASPFLSNGEQHYYEVISGSWTWQNAKANAETRSYLGVAGHLVTIGSGAENSFLSTLSNNGEFWIGLSDAAVEGTFAWVTGEPVVYTNWLSGEPNNQGNIEDYAHIFLGGAWNGLWNDHPNAGPHAYLIEYDVTATPVPAALPLFASVLSSGLIVLRRKRKAAKQSASRRAD